MFVFPEATLGLSPSLLVALALMGLAMFALSFGQTNAIASVFVRDQFSEGQSKGKERSFSWFYLCMNVGQLVAEGGFPVARQSAGFIVTFTIATVVHVSSIEKDLRALNAVVNRLLLRKVGYLLMTRKHQRAPEQTLGDSCCVL